MTVIPMDPPAHTITMTPLYDRKDDDGTYQMMWLHLDAPDGAGPGSVHFYRDGGTLRVTAFPNAEAAVLDAAAVDELLAKLRLIRRQMPA